MVRADPQGKGYDIAMTKKLLLFFIISLFFLCVIIYVILEGMGMVE